MSDGKESWIKLLVKYRGKCAMCGKDIPQGEYALWSRSSKAIKHIKCETVPLQQQQIQQLREKKEGGGEEQLQAQEDTIELKCFICGKKNAGCATCSLEADCNRAMVSQACICESCLSGPDAYDRYQQTFLSKLAGKLKM
ncbi:MAG TPA: hypothetical protein VHA09_08050 [Nitrososphaera sp.]|nr:hypothetical protein [Nitrososphaera sp.]